MATEQIKEQPSLPKFSIPNGWNALYDPALKKVFVLREFPSGGSAASTLSLLTKNTQAELMAEIANLGLSWTPPAPSPTPSNG